MSALLAATTWGLTRESIVNQREGAATTQAFRNATLITQQLASTDTDDEQLRATMASLESESASRALVRDADGSWTNQTTAFDEKAVPRDMLQLVSDGQAARMRVDIDGDPQLLIGVPLPSVDGLYFEFVSLSDTQDALESLSASLFGAAFVTTLTGAALGWWASRRTLRPLADVSVAAEAIAGGRLDTRLGAAHDPDLGVLLAQGGEFGFVVFQAALGGGVIGAEASSLLVAAVAISMLFTPLLLVATDRWLAPRLARRAAPDGPAEIAEPQQAPIIICGFGRYGQIVGRLINANGLSATVLDHSAENVAGVRRFGWPAFYGDATRLDLLRVAGAAQARVIVVAIDDVEQSLAVVDLARQHFPQATLVARARNVTHWYGLQARGVQHIERETLDAALMSGRSVLELMGWQAHAARTQALRFRQHSIELLHQMAPHQGDEKKLIAVAQQGRRELEELWQRERAERAQRQVNRGEGFAAADQAKPSQSSLPPVRNRPR